MEHHAIPKIKRLKIKAVRSEIQNEPVCRVFVPLQMISLHLFAFTSSRPTHSHLIHRERPSLSCAQTHPLIFVTITLKQTAINPKASQQQLVFAGRKSPALQHRLLSVLEAQPGARRPPPPADNVRIHSRSWDANFLLSRPQEEEGTTC